MICDRTIIHADLNNCYASIEAMYYPKLHGRPVAVGGDEMERHGIILARNYAARRHKIRVGMALWQARKLCPGLVIVPPHYDRYIRFSKMFRGILGDYTDKVEPFGCDESWADITASLSNDVSAQSIADEIRIRVREEMGVMASIGVSFNKIFAKLGSDMNKPNGTTIITRDNYKRMIWPLPASELLGVGWNTVSKLIEFNLLTIGDLARCDPAYLHSIMGKFGVYLHIYANGDDSSPVTRMSDATIVKSVGNSTTCPRDLLCEEDALIVLLNLAESVAERMRDMSLMAWTVEICMRSNDLDWCTRQVRLLSPTNISKDLMDAGARLLRENHNWDSPLRSLGIRGTDLVPEESTRQVDMLLGEYKREKAVNLEIAIDSIRRRFGHFAIMPGLLQKDEQLGRLNPKEDNVIHPIGYL